MGKLKVFEAFAGVGTQHMALKRLGIDFEVVGISEIDKFALKSYKAIHGDVENFGDISKIDKNNIPDHDLFTYSFPCTDLSVAGRQQGFTDGTQSSLLYECKKVIEYKKPKYLLLENVKNLIGKKFKDNFDEWLGWLEDQGYTSHWDVLNSKNFNIPQSRDRVFVVSVLNEDSEYKFPTGNNYDQALETVLEDDVDEKYYLSDKIQNRFQRTKEGNVGIIGHTKPEFRTIGQRDAVFGTEGLMGTLVATDYKQPKQIVVENPKLKDILEEEVNEKYYLKKTKDFFINNSLKMEEKGNGFRFQPHIKDKAETASTITTKSGVRMDDNYILEDLEWDQSKFTYNQETLEKVDGITETGVSNEIYKHKIRKLTPLECWRLTGIDDEDFYKAKEAGLSDTQLYKQAGNAIVVNVLEAIFKNLFRYTTYSG